MSRPPWCACDVAGVRDAQLYGPRVRCAHERLFLVRSPWDDPGARRAEGDRHDARSSRLGDASERRWFVSLSVFTEAELRYLAGGRQLGRIATVGVDGTPHVVPVG